MSWENPRKPIDCKSLKTQNSPSSNEKKIYQLLPPFYIMWLWQTQGCWWGGGTIHMHKHEHTASSLSFCKIMNYVKSIPYNMTQLPSQGRESEWVSSAWWLFNHILCTKCLQKSILLCIVLSVQNEQSVQHQISPRGNKSHKPHWIHQCRHVKQKTNQYILNVKSLIWIWNAKAFIMVFQKSK